MLEGVRRSEHRAVLAWVQSRIDHGSTVAEVRGLLTGIASPEPAFDGAVLLGSVKSIRNTLRSGGLDAHLDALAQAESTGKNRKGVFSALEARRSQT